MHDSAGIVLRNTFTQRQWFGTQTATVYENDVNFHVHVRCFSALRFVPIGDIPAVFSQLGDTFPDDNDVACPLQHFCNT